MLLKPYFHNKLVQIYHGNCLNILKELPDNSIHCCITSPPYWGLRDYQVDEQFGLESTPEEYITSMVQVFREVRRILRNDGTFWLNLGDSYATDSKGSGGSSKIQDKNMGSFYQTIHLKHNLKSKDIVGIPWRTALALQSDGWWLRQDIIWSKLNCMPESVTDRCTKSHEYLFMLTKSPHYYYDSEAIKEPVSEISLKRAEYKWDCDRPSTKNASMGCDGIHTEKMGSRFVNPLGRNKRSVWTISTYPYKGAHFATFPPKLVEPCLLAGTSEKGCCSICGKPWARIEKLIGSKTTEWKPECNCGGDIVPCIVLDPFGGAGTTSVVASNHKRKSILCELNEQYCQLAANRIEQEKEQNNLEGSIIDNLIQF